MLLLKEGLSAAGRSFRCGPCRDACEARRSIQKLIELFGTEKTVAPSSPVPNLPRANDNDTRRSGLNAGLIEVDLLLYAADA
jgi:hypothetical protein